MDDPELYDDLAGQVALVTGANRGIGRQIAANLHDLGATVYAGTRSVTHDVPDDWQHVLLDVTQEGDVESTVDGIFDEVGRLDILVNNAGVGEFGDSVERSSTGRASGQSPRADDIVAEPTERIDRTLATNLRGPMLLCKHAVPLLIQREGGRVVNVSSGMGAIGEAQSGGSPAYRISKTGINGLTAYLHGEYAEQGLLANSVCPGWVRTEMGGDGADRSVEEGAETPTWLARFRPGSPAGKFWRRKSTIDW
jgi:NAD(P)-dependent dehydrogenase (short-subunit alcohol dehydrogenase family)